MALVQSVIVTAHKNVGDGIDYRDAHVARDVINIGNKVEHSDRDACAWKYLRELGEAK